MRARVYTHRRHWPSSGCSVDRCGFAAEGRAGPSLPAVGVTVALPTQDRIVAEKLHERFDISLTVELLKGGDELPNDSVIYKPYPPRARRHVRLAHRHIRLFTADAGPPAMSALRDEPHRCGGHLPATGRLTTGLW
jgi:hypothetical protein